MQSELEVARQDADRLRRENIELAAKVDQLYAQLLELMQQNKRQQHEINRLNKVVLAWHAFYGAYKPIYISVGQSHLEVSNLLQSWGILDHQSKPTRYFDGLDPLDAAFSPLPRDYDLHTQVQIDEWWSALARNSDPSSSLPFVPTERTIPPGISIAEYVWPYWLGSTYTPISPVGIALNLRDGTRPVRWSTYAMNSWYKFTQRAITIWRLIRSVWDVKLPTPPTVHASARSRRSSI